MRAEQPTKLCKPQRKIRLKVCTTKTGLNPQKLLLTISKRYFRCGFVGFMFGAVQFLTFLI